MPTLIFEDKFDTGGTWDTSNGTPVIGTTPAPPSAANSLECNAIGDYVFWNIPDSGHVRCVFGVWVQVPAYPATDSRLFKIDAGPSEGWCRLRSNGEFQGNSDGTPTISAFFDSTVLGVNTWRWLQMMYDVSANPWQVRMNISGSITSGTGAAAATNLNPGIFLLGNTTGGSAATYYFGHAKMGVAANDDDWWDEPAASAQATILRPALVV